MVHTLLRLEGCGASVGDFHVLTKCSGRFLPLCHEQSHCRPWGIDQFHRGQLGTDLAPPERTDPEESGRLGLVGWVPHPGVLCLDADSVDSVQVALLLLAEKGASCS